MNEGSMFKSKKEHKSDWNGTIEIVTPGKYRILGFEKKVTRNSDKKVFEIMDLKLYPSDEIKSAPSSTAPLTSDTEGGKDLPF